MNRSACRSWASGAAAWAVWLTLGLSVLVACSEPDAGTGLPSVAESVGSAGTNLKGGILGATTPPTSPSAAVSAPELPKASSAPSRSPTSSPSQAATLDPATGTVVSISPDRLVLSLPATDSTLAEVPVPSSASLFAQVTLPGGATSSVVTWSTDTPQLLSVSPSGVVSTLQGPSGQGPWLGVVRATAANGAFATREVEISDEGEVQAWID